MAERLTKLELKKRGIKNIKVSSRGLMTNGDNISDNAKIVLKKLGASGANRKSVALKKVDPNTLYVTMNEGQKNHVKGGKVISFTQLIGHDIADPYGGSEKEYYRTALDLRDGIKVLLEKILNVGVRK